MVWVQAGGADSKKAPRERVTNGPELEGSEGLEDQFWRAVTAAPGGAGAGGSGPGRDTGEAKEEDTGRRPGRAGPRRHSNAGTLSGDPVSKWKAPVRSPPPPSTSEG